MRHIHVSFLTPLLVFFSALVVFPILRVVTMWQHDKPWAQGLAFASTGY